jgi:hypothetical protein
MASDLHEYRVPTHRFRWDGFEFQKIVGGIADNLLPMFGRPRFRSA